MSPAEIAQEARNDDGFERKYLRVKFTGDWPHTYVQLKNLLNFGGVVLNIPEMGVALAKVIRFEPVPEPFRLLADVKMVEGRSIPVGVIVEVVVDLGALAKEYLSK